MTRWQKAKKLMASGAFWGGMANLLGGLGGSPGFGYFPDKVAAAIMVLGTICLVFSKAIHEKIFEVQE